MIFNGKAVFLEEFGVWVTDLATKQTTLLIKEEFNNIYIKNTTLYLIGNRKIKIYKDFLLTENKTVDMDVENIAIDEEIWICGSYGLEKLQ